MTLQDRMTNMKPYFRGIEMYNDGLIVKVAFPSKWRVYGSLDERIKVAQSDNGNGEFFFYANSNEATYDNIFDLIEEVIRVNQETALKLQLLKDKIEEMKNLFAENDYDRLSTLQFVMDKGTGKEKKGKKGKGKKTDKPLEASTEVTESVITKEDAKDA